MRDDLSIISGISNDADRLVGLIRTSGFLHLVHSHIKLLQLVGQKLGPETFRLMDRMFTQAGTVDAYVQIAQRRPAFRHRHKPKLLEETAKMLRIFSSGLDQVERKLNALCPN